MSCARISGVMYVLIGLVIGAVVSLISVLGGLAAAGRDNVPFAMFGAAAIVVLPIFYGVIGFVASYIGAVLYNWMAKLVGGVELDLQ
jgi:hypothetical protein